MYSFAAKGLLSQCKPCNVFRNQRWREENARKLQGQPLPAEKRCAKCKHTLPGDEYGEERGTKDGLSPVCLACERKRKVVWELQRRQLFGNTPPVHPAAKERICLDCKAITPWTDLARSLRVGIRPLCRTCANTRLKSYRGRKEQTEKRVGADDIAPGSISCDQAGKPT